MDTGSFYPAVAQDSVERSFESFMRNLSSTRTTHNALAVRMTVAQPSGSLQCNVIQGYSSCPGICFRRAQNDPASAGTAAVGISVADYLCVSPHSECFRFKVNVAFLERNQLSHTQPGVKRKDERITIWHNRAVKNSCNTL